MAEEEKVEAKEGMSTTKLIIIMTVVVLVISGGMAGLTIYLVGGQSNVPVAADGSTAEAAAAPAAPAASAAIYHRLDPKFVVSFNDQSTGRYMQFSLQVMTRDQDVVDKLKEHDPVVRNNLLLLFNNQTSEVMNTREGKEQLLVQIKDDVNTSLKALGAIPGIEAAYFDSFLIQ